LLISLIVSNTALIISSVAFPLEIDSYNIFQYAFPSIYGFGIGIGYMLPFYVVWLYFPYFESLYTGILISSTALGMASFSRLQSQLFNPDNELPVKDALPESIYQHFPFAM